MTDTTIELWFIAFAFITAAMCVWCVVALNT